MKVRPRACERAAEFVSLELDGELSLFERAMLKRHLQRCEPCAVYARNVTGLTELLRAAPVEQFRVPIVSSRSPRRVARVVQGVGAAVAVVAVGVWLGASSSGGSKTPPRVVTVTPHVDAGTLSDDRSDWPAGLPQTTREIRLFPGGLSGSLGL
jgi:predicted anti-sigma-YlaC factor YlaD